ncbi:DUF512 domain-containing protein [Niameybacter massiliensis]|uniref:DUF512 domain-containing protein n=1 Tax=Holtiella tumoricola TaxID=3018743 RepID=A0AA42DP60_9FIRM|nr:DUF512 domain-containing protein [Holtiella tumoricola]MDA3732555.1 DUF512 domain-containing protein [Holtiella tumoricola]
MKNTYKSHLIVDVLEDSIAKELELEKGDKLLSINGERIQDVFDYRFLLSDEEIEVKVEKANGEVWDFEIEKDYGDDLGLVFETELMDELLKCRNKCKFCFIDQLPPNMRQTVYFKDDDWRMSFLNGNYITLTNISEYDQERMIKYRLSPLNVSIHATDPEVRQTLLHNRFAGKIMEQLGTLVDHGIQINGQIVLCPGLNDGKVLDQTIQDLSTFIPDILSLTVVPVGVSKFRENLPYLESFNEESAREVVEVIEKWQKYYLEKMGTRFVFAADEFYITGKMPKPSYDEYEGFPVLDNGVGMLTKFEYELEEALKEATDNGEAFECSIATGCITEVFMKNCVAKLEEKFSHIKIHVYPIINEYFGEYVTVTGLLTGQDIVKTLKSKQNLGKVLLIAENMLKCGEEVFLDDYTVDQLKSELGVPVLVMPNEGQEWLDKILHAKGEIK